MEQAYNFQELRKNYILFVRAFNEGFRKLKEETNPEKRKRLETRIELSNIMGTSVISSFRGLMKDEISSQYCQTIKTILGIYRRYKDGRKN